MQDCDHVPQAYILGESNLAYSTPDGSVGIIIVRQTVNDSASSIETQVIPPALIDMGDRRQISALAWLDVSVTLRDQCNDRAGLADMIRMS